MALSPALRWLGETTEEARRTDGHLVEDPVETDSDGSGSQGDDRPPGHRFFEVVQGAQPEEIDFDSFSDGWSHDF
jgi:hypothetical protein